MTDLLTIAERRTDVLDKIKAAAKRAGRDDLPALIAVSKVQPDARVKAMLESGQRIYGENRVQEAQSRWGETFAAHRKDLTLHLIGPLQTNKSDDAVALFDVIETVDREKLVKHLLKSADKIGRLPRLYVQVNTGEEPQKAGVLPADLPAFLARMKSEYDLTPEGLMCIPPVGQAASPHFWFLGNLARDHGIAKLSMGMSGDYEVATEMGATSVRVGSAMFGARDYD
ncbi:YggS family pyridoxal phosphate-dependent enzyme [Litorimonas sp. RW-G-Af-16]|uniref:YggS family pyridoxal phosphate-dependent enzyme n=1 Tax=Litorimonas sp. RW-G-Af-16 TaxID=3241168 RepID=UPI00390C6D78